MDLSRERNGTEIELSEGEELVDRERGTRRRRFLRNCVSVVWVGCGVYAEKEE